MAPSEHPETPPDQNETPATTGIQTPAAASPSAEGPSISLPPLPQPPTIDPTSFLRLRGKLDAVLVVVVLLFAFLAASFPVSNPDFFRQLATGRLLAHGEYHFGIDPFVYSATDNDYFVNHSWLFALLMYGLYQLPTVGAAAVVIFKALVVVALAEMLLRGSRRPGQSLWIPAACTILAILVVSPRLHLQPSCLSFLFLGATLCLLSASGDRRTRFWWLLPPLFALWVNCDQWFFLGPLTVGLYLIGGGESDTSGQRRLNTLGLVFLVGVAACLLNPHHIHAFTLPPEFGLAPAGDLIENDPQFHVRFLSPLRKEFYQPHFGLSAAGLAYWPLFLLGLVSFVFVFGRTPRWRLLVWVVFAVLSLYNARTIPFFAVVAGPITALNWLDYAAQRLGSAPRLTTGWHNWSLGGRILTVLLGLALVIVTVPGWLQSQPQERRRLGWSVHVDSSLKVMAEAIHGWRQTGLLDEHEPHWFNMQYEVANYLAWFAPGERAFLDQSLPSFRKAAEDYSTLRQVLKEMPDEEPNSGHERIALKEVRAHLRSLAVRYWICDIRSNDKSNLIAQWMLFSHPKEWILCHLQGRVAIFAWRDPQEHTSLEPSRGLALDLKKAAFGPEAEPAPPRGPEPAPPRSWWETAWDMWWRPAPLPSLDREVVPLYAFRFQVAERPRQIERHSRAWQASIAASAIVGSLSRGPVPSSLLPLSWICTYSDLFPTGAAQASRPLRNSERLAMQAVASYVGRQFVEPPSLYLGIRAARRALLVNPEDGISYFRLGQVYQQLHDLPQERNPLTSSPRLLAIRRTQMAAAYQNCLRLQPNHDNAAQAHEALFKLYAPPSRNLPFGLGYLDAAAHHLREALDNRTAAGPPAGSSATQYNQQLDGISAELTKLDAELERRRNSYEVRSASKSGLEKVKIALDLGLSETALTALEEAADAKVRTQDDLNLIKDVTAVALDLGRLDRARELLLPDPESMAGESVRPDYLDLHLRLAAGRGDYAEADRLLADALRHAWKPPTGQPGFLDPARTAAEAIGRVLLNTKEKQTSPLRFPSPFHQLSSDFWVRRWRMEAIANSLQAAFEQAEGHYLRGWLALEAGQCVEARKHFEAARDTTVLGENWVPEIKKVDGWLIPEKEAPPLQQLGQQHSVLHELSKRYLNWLDEERQR